VVPEDPEVPSAQQKQKNIIEEHEIVLQELNL
jgi:hypothetical protein